MRPLPILATTVNGALRDWRAWLLALLSLGVVLAVLALPPIPSPPHYANFADQRTILGIANFSDVISNVPFLLLGAWGLYLVAADERRAFSLSAEKWPYGVLFLCVALTSVGSAYYHLSPDDVRLTWDRLPIALGFMALLSALIAERISIRAGLYLLIPLLLVAAATVAHWRASMIAGAEDVAPYAAVQYGAIAAVVLIAVLYRPRYSHSGYLFMAVAFYALAKGAEVLDGPIFELGQLISGHTLKHLLAALSVWWLLRMLKVRSAA